MERPDHCNFNWAIKLPDDKIISSCSGKLKPLIDESEYPNGIIFGAYMELLGGNLGQLVEFLKKDYPDLVGETIEVLIEGRWREVTLQ